MVQVPVVRGLVPPLVVMRGLVDLATLTQARPATAQEPLAVRLMEATAVRVRHSWHKAKAARAPRLMAGMMARQARTMQARHRRPSRRR